jgi:hypothetical protein
MTDAATSNGVRDFTPAVPGAPARRQQSKGHSAVSTIAMPMIPVNASLAGEIDRHGNFATRRDHERKI